MSNLQWWCAAAELPWTWDWRPYPGVWLFVALVALAYARVVRLGAAEGGWPPLRRAAGIGGVLTVWLALDWPVGALGGGYLASVHMVQYLALAFLAPTLLLAGLPAGTSAALARRPAVRDVLRRLTHPVFAALLFTTVFIATHAPLVTDTLMAGQLGSFALDLAWLASGLLFWWPIIGTPPGREPLAPLFKIGTIILGTVAHTPLGMWLMMTEFPVYRTYELAPPMPPFTPRMDQQLASGLMLTVGWLYVLGAITVTFFRWQGMSEERNLGLGEPEAG